MHGDTQVHTILRLEAKDAAEIARLEKECFSSAWTEEQYCGLLGAAAARETDRHALPVWLAFGARLPDGGIAGYISLGVDSWESCLEVLNIAVWPALRRKGIAGSMLRHVLAWSRDFGFERCLLDVRENNLPAVALYKKAGFEMLGRRRKYYSDTGENALVMVCDLLAAPGFQGSP